MGYRKDLKSVAKKGRYFPLRFGDAVRLIKENNLKDLFGYRIKVRMENTEGKSEYGFPVADIIPNEDIAIYSLPEELPQEACSKLAIEALSKLVKLRLKEDSYNKNKYSYFCAYIDSNGELSLRITRKDISLQKGKYRGDAKFSNAFNTKKTNMRETEI